uniref:Uncharacterized protein n=1 Tax=Strongyloides venezuelensis TaxID=75913 RepID=A0A0K0F0Q3_STRVS
MLRSFSRSYQIFQLKFSFDKNSFYCDPKITVNAFVANKSENIFDDIPCIDSTRVVLDPTIGLSDKGSEFSPIFPSPKICLSKKPFHSPSLFHQFSNFYLGQLNTSGCFLSIN